MAIDYQRMQARTTRMLRQNGATYNVTRKGSVTVIGGVEHKTEAVRFTAVGVKTEYAPGEIDGTVIVNGDVQIVLRQSRKLKSVMWLILTAQPTVLSNRTRQNLPCWCSATKRN